MRRVLLVALCAVALASAAAQEVQKGTTRWLNIFYQDTDGNTRVVANPTSQILGVTHSKSAGDGYDKVAVATDDAFREVATGSVTNVEVGTNVPTIYITTDEYCDEITSKTEYSPAVISMDANGAYDDMAETPVSIRGRGNSSWTAPKKPYRLKFGSKVSLCGLTKAKSYALIANFIDNTLMRNAVALKLAGLLGMPYTNHCIPVNVVLNGKYRGAYMLTEKIGITKASVDIDEEEGILWELSAEYDSDYQFRSPVYDLPVMVKDPDVEEIADVLGISTDDYMSGWQADFETMEAAVKAAGAGMWEQIDMASLADYMLVCAVCQNLEINYPKSLYLYKKRKGEKYYFGPVWDFDWAFTFCDGERQGANGYEECLITWNAFLLKLIRDNQFMTLYRERWAAFVSDIFPRLLEYFDSYADIIEVSAAQNGEAWPYPNEYFVDADTSEHFRSNVTALRQWLVNRVEWLSAHKNLGLYE